MASNFGAQPILRTGGGDESLLRFDLGSIPSSAAITSATLKLYISGGGGTDPINAHRITSPWQESSVTYASFGQQFDPTLIGVIDTPSANAQKSINLAAQVTRWLSGAQANYGVLIESNSIPKTTFVSREGGSAAQKPQLEVCFSQPDDHCSPDPCQNGATCENGTSSYTCHCAPGYTGTNCETLIDNCASQPCLNGGSCTSAAGGYTCTCPLGYTGTNCETVIDYCASTPCANGGVCQNGIGSYSCACPTGYTGANCDTLIDNCAATPCQNGATCTNDVGGYTCACTTGFTGTNCETNIDDCAAQPCLNGGTCIDGIGTYTCSCPPDWGGTTCDINLNTCSQNPCLNGATCVNGFGSYSCTCATGFAGANCEIDINDCAVNPCQNGGVCVDGVNSYTCTCPSGFIGTNCETAITATACYSYPGYYVWPSPAVATSVAGVPTNPVDDTAPYSYFTQGATVFAYNNADGSSRWSPTALSASILDDVTPVALTTGSEVIFVASEDARLSKIDAAAGTVRAWVDTRRSASGAVPPADTVITDPVCASDQLVASPVVELGALANSAFRTAMANASRANDDLLFVISNDLCGDTTHNTIRAYYASDLTRKWVFNNNTSNTSGSATWNIGGHGKCALWYGTDGDPAANTLYCATDGSPTEDTLWAINAVTGALKWSYAAGPIQHRPVVYAGRDGLRVYVVNASGDLVAFSPVADPANAFRGLTLWSSAGVVPLGVVAAPVAYTADTGATGLVVVDRGGNVRTYEDAGTAAISGPAQNPTGTLSSTVCAAGTLCYLGRPQVSIGASSTKVYVGRSDGRVQQLNDTLTFDAAVDVHVDFSKQTTMSLSVDGASLVAVAADGTGGYVSRLELPLCPSPPPQ